MSRTVLVTGATDGLGRGLAGALAVNGDTVLLHGRDERRGREVMEEIGAEGARWYQADLASLKEVRELAAAVEREHDRLDVLVNNAGIGTTGEREESRDGHELRFAVNYLAPYVLSRRLLRLLTRSAPARIVNVSSAGQATLDFDDLMLERSYSGVQAYCQSKLALVMLTFDLAEELRESGVTANCLHPGTYMPTKMVREAGVNPIDSLESGVQATLRLVSDPGLETVTGRYFDRGHESQPHPQAGDAEARRRLREESERLAGS